MHLPDKVYLYIFLNHYMEQELLAIPKHLTSRQVLVGFILFSV